jgi:phage shock protein C
MGRPFFIQNVITKREWNIEQGYRPLMSKPVLKKSNDKMVSGVCGGIAEYLGWQPKHVRAIFVIVALAGGSGLLAYLILYIAMPGPDDVVPPPVNQHFD